MAPVGWTTRTLGTNPIAYAAPSQAGISFLFDMSCSATAAAKILLAARQGSELEPGLLQDKSGNPTTDSNDLFEWSTDGTLGSSGGAVLPTGGPKGYGMALVVDMLCGVLTGASFGMDLHADTTKRNKPGHFVWAIDIQQFMELDEFETRMQRRSDEIKSGDTNEGVGEILLPGERGIKLKQESLSRGTMQLSNETWNVLDRLHDISGVPLPDAS